MQKIRIIITIYINAGVLGGDTVGLVRKSDIFLLGLKMLEVLGNLSKILYKLLGIQYNRFKALFIIRLQ